MAKMLMLRSTTAGSVPTAAQVQKAQLAINIADKKIYTQMPDGNVELISDGSVAGITPAPTQPGMYIPVGLFPICQFGVGYTEAQLGSAFTIGASSVTLNSIPIVIFGRKIYIPATTGAVQAGGAYSLFLDLNNKTISINAPSTLNYSGMLNYNNLTAELIFYSSSHIYPWFYVPHVDESAAGVVNLIRISPYQTNAAIPVSIGQPMVAATSYWG